MALSDRQPPSLLAALTNRKGALVAAPAALALGALLTLAVPTPAQTQSGGGQSGGVAPAASGPSPFSDDQKSAIEQIIKNYLLTNPEVMVDVQQALESKMEKINAEKAKVAIQSNASEIYRRADAPTVGNLKGDVTIVEFFDYNCGYCKRGFGDLAKLIESDSKVKVIMKELPILSKGSEEAARVAIAAKAQGKYWEFHKALITSRGQANEASALKIAEKLGLDMAKLKVDMASETTKSEIATVRQLAQKMGIQGTPHFLVGEHAIPGAPENLFETLTQLVAQVRKEGCKVC